MGGSEVLALLYNLSPGCLSILLWFNFLCSDFDWARSEAIDSQRDEKEGQWKAAELLESWWELWACTHTHTHLLCFSKNDLICVCLYYTYKHKWKHCLFLDGWQWLCCACLWIYLYHQQTSTWGRALTLPAHVSCVHPKQSERVREGERGIKWDPVNIIIVCDISLLEHSLVP